MYLCTTDCGNNVVMLANSLKNLFYRILHLYSAGVNLVFVIEGAVPSPLKVSNDSTAQGRENFMKRVGEVQASNYAHCRILFLATLCYNNISICCISVVSFLIAWASRGCRQLVRQRPTVLISTHQR